MSFIGDKSITMPPSQVPKPATLCPPPRIAVSRWLARAKLTALITSLLSVQRTISSGRLSIIPFQTVRASS
jgi:hypothetical protein